MRQKSVHIVYAAVLAFLAATCPAWAQQSTPIGVFSFQKTLENSAEGKKAIAKIQLKEQVITRELGALDQQIQALETKQKNQSLVLSFEAQQQLSLDLDNLRINSIKLWTLQPRSSSGMMRPQ